MDDLRQRFAAIDRVPAPDLWPEIERRAEVRAAAGASPVVNATWPRRVGQSRSGERGLVLVLAALLVIASAAAGALIIGSRRPDNSLLTVVPPSVATAAPTTRSADPAGSDCPAGTTGSALSVTDIGVSYWLDRPVFAACSIWLQAQGDVDRNGVGLQRVDMTTNTLAATLFPGVSVEGVAARSDQVWALIPTADGRGSSLVRIDPASNLVVETIDVPARGLDLAITGDHASVLAERISADGTRRENELLDIDLTTHSTSTTSLVGGREFSPVFIGVGSGSAWLMINGVVSRVDLGTHAVTPVAAPPDDLGCVLSDAGLYCGTGHGQVIRISPVTNSVDWSFQVPDWPALGGWVGVATMGADVWAFPRYLVPHGSEYRVEAREIFHLDAATGEVVERFDLPVHQPLGGLALGGGSLWLDAADRPLIRIQIPVPAAP